MDDGNGDGDAWDDAGDVDGDAWDDAPASALAEEVLEVFDDVDDPEAVHAAMERGEFERAYEMMGITPEEAEALIERWSERAESILREDG